MKLIPYTTEVGGGDGGGDAEAEVGGEGDSQEAAGAAGVYQAAVAGEGAVGHFDGGAFGELGGVGGVDEVEVVGRGGVQEDAEVVHLAARDAGEWSVCRPGLAVN